MFYQFGRRWQLTYGGHNKGVMNSLEPLWVGIVAALVAAVVVGLYLVTKRRRHSPLNHPSLDPALELSRIPAPPDKASKLMHWTFRIGGKVWFWLAVLVGFGDFSQAVRPPGQPLKLLVPAGFYAVSVACQFLAAGKGGSGMVMRKILKNYLLLAAFVTGFIGAQYFMSPNGHFWGGMEEFVRRFEYWRQGGNGESADWGEPFFYMCIFGVPAGLLFLLVIMLGLKLIDWLRHLKTH